MAARLASDTTDPRLKDTIASNLAILDVPAPDWYLENLKAENTPALHYYDYLLKNCERLFDNEIDQITFEEIARYMFGTKVRQISLVPLKQGL